MRTEFDELSKEHQNIDKASASMKLYGLINDSEVASPAFRPVEDEEDVARKSSSLND